MIHEYKTIQSFVQEGKQNKISLERGHLEVPYIKDF